VQDVYCFYVVSKDGETCYIPDGEYHDGDGVYIGSRTVLTEEDARKWQESNDRSIALLREINRLYDIISSLETIVSKESVFRDKIRVD
jgi:hypothetical protein